MSTEVPNRESTELTSKKTTQEPSNDVENPTQTETVKKSEKELRKERAKNKRESDRKYQKEWLEKAKNEQDPILRHGFKRIAFEKQTEEQLQSMYTKKANTIKLG